MNTSQYMDKQIMDLASQGSTPTTATATTTATQTKDFIDLINHNDHHHHPEEEEKDDRHSHHDDEDGIKREEIVPSYDFQPLRPITAPAMSNSVSGLNFDGGSARAWMSGSLDSKLNANSSPIRNYSSFDSLESTKVVMEKDRHSIDASMVSEIDQTMKKHVDSVLHALEGVSARLTQLESRTRSLENSVDDLKVSVGNNYGSADGKMRQMENILIEVQTGVQVLKDKQDIMEGQLQLAKLHISKTDQRHESQNASAVDSVQQPASASQQSLQQPPPPTGTYQPPPPTMPIPNTLPPSQQNLPPPVPIPNQFSQTQTPPVPPREPYYPPPAQAQEASTQQYQLPPTQQPHQPPAAPPPQQYPPTPQQLYPQPTHPPQQRPSTPPVNPPQIQPPMGHHLDEASFGLPQTYPSTLHLPTSQPSAGPPPSQQLYGPPNQMYEPPSRASSGFSAGYGHPSGPGDSYPYGGPPPQYASNSPRKSQQHPQGSGSGYPQLPTARMLPQTLPTATASSLSSGLGSSGNGNRVPVDDVVDKVTSMGFPRDQVRATVRRLTENGQSVDLNIVLDKLMNDSDVQPPRGWFGR